MNESGVRHADMIARIRSISCAAVRRRRLPTACTAETAVRVPIRDARAHTGSSTAPGRPLATRANPMVCDHQSTACT